VRSCRPPAKVRLLHLPPGLPVSVASRPAPDRERRLGAGRRLGGVAAVGLDVLAEHFLVGHEGTSSLRQVLAIAAATDNSHMRATPGHNPKSHVGSQASGCFMPTSITPALIGQILALRRKMSIARTVACPPPGWLAQPPGCASPARSHPAPWATGRMPSDSTFGRTLQLRR